MAPATHFDALTGRLGWRARRRSLANSISQGFQVVGHSSLVRLADRKPDHLPAAGSGHPVGVPGAQVIAVRLHEGCQRPEYGGRVAVDVGQRVQGGLLAGRP